MNKDSYDNFMTTFKKSLWDTCLQQRIFEDLNNTDFEKVKSIFETNIENYKTHILQTNGGESITETLIFNMKKEIQNIRKNVETREDISNMRKTHFASEFEKKQTEFNSLLKREKPDDVNFSDKTQDGPLEADNLEALIQEQLKDRELHIPTPSTESNTIVSGNQFTEPGQDVKLNTSDLSVLKKEEMNNCKNIGEHIESKLVKLLDENTKLISDISILKQQINSQNDAIHKILSSQILILKKLK